MLVPEVTVPFAVMNARPLMTCNAPVTIAALPGMRVSSGTMAMGLAGIEAAGTETTEVFEEVCAVKVRANQSKQALAAARRAGRRLGLASAGDEIRFTLHFQEVLDHLMAALREHALGMELDTLHGQLAMTQAHDDRTAG